MRSLILQAALSKRQEELGGARKTAAVRAAEQEEEVAKLTAEIEELQEKLGSLDAGTGGGSSGERHNALDHL